MFFFACVVRIYERPFWWARGTFQFSTLSSALWLTIITMTTVGYGNMIPSTSPGRCIIVIAIIVGAIILGWLVAVISSGFDLEDDKKESLVKVIDQKTAGHVIMTALKYN